MLLLHLQFLNFIIFINMWIIYSSVHCMVLLCLFFFPLNALCLQTHVPPGHSHCSPFGDPLVAAKDAISKSTSLRGTDAD